MVGAGGGGKPSGQSDVYFEFTQIGGQMRVAAIDARTGTEVILIVVVVALLLVFGFFPAIGVIAWEINTIGRWLDKPAACGQAR